MTTDPATAGSLYKLCPRCQHIYPATSSFCPRDRAELAADDRIFAGKFILQSKIGEGSMGSVYEAVQPQIGRKVAVKVLRPDKEVMMRFEREVRSAGALNHANVVTIHDSGTTEDGRGYIAMELLEGESLTRHLEQQGPLAPMAALQLWAQAVRGISAAHSKGIVHRDLKPDNLFIARRSSDEGTEAVLKVLDFGIAKFQRGGPARGTTPGMIVGTMQYMAPEQLEGAEADPRVDVYALGLILVEMLSGQLPWGQGKELSLSQFTLRLVVPPTPLTKLRPEQPFSAELLKLVEDMLALDPNLRPASGGELFHRLRYLPEAPAALRPDGGDRASSSALQRFPDLSATARPSSGMADRASGALPGRLRGRRALWLGLALMVPVGLATVYFFSAGQRSPPPARPLDPPPVSAPPVLAQPGAVPPTGAKSGEPVAAPGLAKGAVHHPLHPGGNPLKVQFAFTESKGVTLTCGGKKQPPPSCAAGGICKSVAVVLAGQKCIAEKGPAKTSFSYNDLKNNPPDRKNLIHVLVRFP